MESQEEVRFHNKEYFILFKARIYILNTFVLSSLKSILSLEMGYEKSPGV
ncbi:hypothetical protein [Acidianus sulfidivorans]|nr:hypothetical protein [Acidianus sulfidivorans]